MTWDEAVAIYRKGHMPIVELRPYWDTEFEKHFGAKVPPDRVCQIDPLFTCGWSPKDAAEHATIVWALKRWEK